MAQKMLAVRGVNEDAYRKFREKAVAKKTSVGTALTEAMLEWVKKERKNHGIDVKNLLKIAGIIKTKKKVNWSGQIDEFLYGAEK